MSKITENPQVEFEQDAFEFRIFLIVYFITQGIIIYKPDARVSKKLHNPHLDSNKLHPKYLLLMIVSLLGIRKHMNFLPYLLLPPIDLNDVVEVRIQYNLHGYFESTPHNAEYRLQYKDDILVGEGRFSATYLKIRKSTDISIPAEIVESFLRILETIRIQDKPCRSGRIMTDNYPYASISLLTDTGQTKIASTSQFKGYIPWCAIIHGYQYKVNSDIPMQALEILEPYLKRHILDKMTDESW